VSPLPIENQDKKLYFDSIDFSSLHNFRNSIDAIDCSLLTG